MNLEELRSEWDSPQRIGPKITKQVRTLCAQTSKNYLAATYSESPQADTKIGSIWDEDDLDDLEIRAHIWLLDADQFTEAFDRANNIGHWNNFIARQIRHMLAHRTNKTPIDNLMERSAKILDQPPYESVKTPTHTWYCLGAEPDPEKADPTGSHDFLERQPGFGDATKRVTLIAPQNFDLSRARERNPRIFNKPELETCLEGIAIAYPHGFTKALVEKVFKNVFTFLDIPGLTSLEVHTEGGGEDETVENSVVDLELSDTHDSLTEQEVVNPQSATRLMSKFDKEEREILRRWAFKETHDQIGKALDLGVRQTVAKRIDELEARLVSVGQELIDEGLTADAMEEVTAEFMRLLSADPGNQGDSYE